MHPFPASPRWLIKKAGVAWMMLAFRSHGANLMKAYIPQTTQASVSPGEEANVGLVCLKKEVKMKKKKNKEKLIINLKQMSFSPNP